ncbi:bifunctional protein GlmU [Dissulfurispira thermophila]|uniref:Bifunctional protein GlmU n=2 Tax=root TaxID=1 RepID=A0A7G1H0Z9_9BACT|nr:bifunctional UDP-N-acetylglucosamine diphosphorylase/glucosamine-1-phosphate N-acetyltransferase GlmU [Dissulfurispira thermophila]BCB95813.1 bifunctional protein GlmU [Dissulfurispira thermophila]
MKSSHPLTTVVLAAGLGTRMKSSVPKVLHKIYGKPIIHYVIDSIKPLKSENNIIVIGSEGREIKNTINKHYKKNLVTFAIQKEPKGTGDALKVAINKLKGFNGTVLILSGDTPLISTITLQKFLRLHRQNKEDISIISFIAEGNHSYGRIIREGKQVKAIIEDRDVNNEQKKIKEVNSGIYAIKSHMLKLLNEIKINKAKGEYYLTDIVDIAVRKGYKVGAHIISNETELTGINTRQDLHNALHYLRDRIISKWINSGISFIDKPSVFIHPDVKIGIDTIIYSNIHIEGRTIIGKGCTIYPNVRITDSIIEDNVTIKDSTVIESSLIKKNAVIGPFAHLRPGSIIGSSSKIGNFVEIKNSIIGEGTKASHLSYLGDAQIGKNVNIGAGAITCNYDGKKKNKTIIEDDSFIGSDSQLIAPVRIGKGAYIGAGSTITQDVPPLSLAISRVKQRHIEQWTTRKQIKKEKLEMKKDKKSKR